MLPFLKKSKTQSAGISMEYRKPDEDQKSSTDMLDDSALEACADDLMRAVSSGDKKSAARALRAAFQILDSEPHEEGEHLNESEQE